MSGLDVYDYAFLRGGPRAAFLAALGDLENRGVLRSDGERRTVVGALGADAGPLPRAIVAAVARWPDASAYELGSDAGVAAALGDVERRLVDRDLWRTGRAVGVGCAAVPVLLIAVVASAIVYGESSRDRSSRAAATLFLVAAGCGVALSIARAALGRRAGPTATGADVLEDARKRRAPAGPSEGGRVGAPAAAYGAPPVFDPLWQFALWGPFLHGPFGGAREAGATSAAVVGGSPSTGAVESWSAGAGGAASFPSSWGADAAASPGVEPLFGGGSSGGGFGGDWSSGGADAGGGGFDGGGGDSGGGGGGGDSGGGGGGGD